MSASENAGLFRIIERQHGQLLRLQASRIQAMEIAADLLGFLEAELEAEIESAGRKSGRGLEVAEPVLIRLEDLDVEVVADGSEVMLRRVSGSADEFEDLCDLVADEFDRD